MDRYDVVDRGEEGGADENAAAEAFVERWSNVLASELATAQSFVVELCELLGVERPHATAAQDYMFERPVTFHHGDGHTSAGRIDCYRRGHFVLEAKKQRVGTHTRSFDEGLQRARGQAESYARALPPEEGRPPFVVVVDVGEVIELYSEFSRSGGTYVPFPDPRGHRLALGDLRRDEIRERLRLVWTDPLELDPARANAEVTREVAQRLAVVARSLEAAGNDPEVVAGFLTRCLFTMFCEDIDMLPGPAVEEGAFTDLLVRHREAPKTLASMMTALWREMDAGGFSTVLAKQLVRFNGKLFKGADKPDYALVLDAEQIDTLLEAARADWKDVEPSIFGTLLERALDPRERSRLGAHYTPRAYVERLVLPTVIEPLRAEWADVEAAALVLAEEAADAPKRSRETKLRAARDAVRTFHERLCAVRVLDPACGSGNFLYVSFEHVKRLEGEVVDRLAVLGESQDRLSFDQETVTPRQFLGIEINARAAALAELVLWIGFLQMHIRTTGKSTMAEPIIHDYGNIETRDALIDHDDPVARLDDAGETVTQWDGYTLKDDPTTGRQVPDDRVRRTVLAYPNARPAEWPQADFIVGNPPFIGSKRMRDRLGDGYVDALQEVYPDVPPIADLMMRWWHRAALAVRGGDAERFGLITSNSIRQTYVRRAVTPHLEAKNPLSLSLAIPDHPWVDASDGAAVRIALTVGERGTGVGVLREVVSEHDDVDEGEDLVLAFSDQVGVIGADLRVGANLAAAVTLRANDDLCTVGMKTIGSAFQITRDQAEALGIDDVAGLGAHIRPYMNGNDFLKRPRGKWVVDLFGLESDEVRTRFPTVFQYLIENAKPERDQQRNPTFKERWWVIGHPRVPFRDATRGLERYIVTVETSKHRLFGFLPTHVTPDSTLVTFGLDDAFHLGVLSSSVHVRWALARGGLLESRPRYNKTVCFETFPFPEEPDEAIVERVRALAEQIEAHRSARREAAPSLTLTSLYTVLEKVRAGEELTDAERRLHESGQVRVLLSLHDDLDAAVLDAYGWDDLTLPTDEPALLARLLDLNAERAREETRGTVRWLRPDYQHPEPAAAPTLDVETEDVPDETVPVVPVAERSAWPSKLPEQIKLVADLLRDVGQPVTIDEVGASFRGRGRWRDRLPLILESLEALGRVRHREDDRWHHVERRTSTRSAA